MTYKEEVNELQTNAICQKWYTYQVCMCTDTVTKICLDKSMSQLYVRVMDIFDTVEVKHHQCAMDNLYNSSALS